MATVATRTASVSLPTQVKGGRLMPLYRFRRPFEPDHCIVAADEYERDGNTVVFVGVTEFDGEERPRQRVVERVAGAIEILD